MIFYEKEENSQDNYTSAGRFQKTGFGTVFGTGATSRTLGSLIMGRSM